MASITSRTFTVGLSNASDSTSRAARRVIINAEILKAAKLYAGDVLTLSAPGTGNKVRKDRPEMGHFFELPAPVALTGPYDPCFLCFY